MWEPESPEQESVSQVRPQAQVGLITTWIHPVIYTGMDLGGTMHPHFSQHPALLYPIAAPTPDPTTAFRLCPARYVYCLPIQFPPEFN